MANQTAELSKHTEAANEDIATSTSPDPEISIKNVNAKTSVLQITGWKIQKLLQSMHMLKKLHKLKKTAPSKKVAPTQADLSILQELNWFFE